MQEAGTIIEFSTLLTKTEQGWESRLMIMGYDSDFKGLGLTRQDAVENLRGKMLRAAGIYDSILAGVKIF